MAIRETTDNGNYRATIDCLQQSSGLAHKGRTHLNDQ